MEAEWLSLMVTEASYQNVASRDVYGARTGGSVVTFKCHIKRNRKEAYVADGNVVTYGGTVYMDAVYDIGKNAILNLPDGTKPKILNVQTFYDEVGAHHTTVDFEG
jgi:hypothetical protein